MTNEKPPRNAEFVLGPEPMQRPKKRWWQFRSSRTGRYVRERDAAANKDTTQSEERKRGRRLSVIPQGSPQYSKGMHHDQREAASQRRVRAWARADAAPEETHDFGWTCIHVTPERGPCAMCRSAIGTGICPNCLAPVDDHRGVGTPTISCVARRAR